MKLNQNSKTALSLFPSTNLLGASKSIFKGRQLTASLAKLSSFCLVWNLMSADHEIIIFHSNSCQRSYQSNQLANPGGAIWMKCYYQNVSVICFWNGRRKCLTSAENEIREGCSPLGTVPLRQGFLHRLLGALQRYLVMNDTWYYNTARWFSMLIDRVDFWGTEKYAFYFISLLALPWLVEQIHCNFCKLFFFFPEIL